MKHLFFVSILVVAFTFRYKMPTTALKDTALRTATQKDTATIAGNWKLLPVLASDTAAGKIPQLNFDLTTNRFSGNDGCNAISGNFHLKQDALSFDENMMSTKMACPGYNEKAFIDNLLKTNRYEIKNGVLQLMYNTTILSKWVRHTDTTLTKHI